MAVSFEKISTDQWFVEIVQFQNNPEDYLTKRSLDKEAFVVDVTQALWSEDVSTSAKLQLLELLQEHTPWICKTVSSRVEQIVGTLCGLFQQLPQEGSKSVLFGSLLSTTTSVIISCDHIEVNREQSQTVIGLLLDTISHVNVGGDRYVRRAACECLLELERNYPGLLSSKLEHLYHMAQMENTGAMQSYSSLFTLVLKHTMQILATQSERIPPSKLNELLCNRTETLKPCIIQDATIQTAKSLITGMKESKQLPEHLDCSELNRVILFLLNHVHLMTPAGQTTVLQTLHEIMKLHPKLPSQLLGQYCQRSVKSTNPLLLHLSHRILSELQKPDKASLQTELMEACTVGFTLPQELKLLCLQWIQGDQVGEIPADTLNDILIKLAPSPFENTEVQKRKLLHVADLVLAHTPPDKAAAILETCLANLYKVVSMGATGRVVSVLFQCLYHIYCKSQHQLIADLIIRMVKGVVSQQPQLLHHCIHLVSSIQSQWPESTVPDDLLTGVLDEVIQQASEQLSSHFTAYTSLLQHAVTCSSITPKKILSLLGRLWEAGQASQDCWTAGHRLLSVCRAVMQHHNMSEAYLELGDFLTLILNYSTDLDVRDRAQQLYTMFTCLSDKKVTAMLNQPQNTKDHENIANIVKGNGALMLIGPAVHITEPVLHLVRNGPRHVTCDKFKNITYKEDPEDLKNQIISGLTSQVDTKIMLDYRLHYDSQAISDDLGDLNTVFLQFMTPETYRPLPDITVPYIWKKDGQDTEVKLSFVPLDPADGHFGIRSTFSNEENQTYYCDLPPISVHFHDIFMTLPLHQVTSDLACKTFDLLWTYIEQITEYAGRSVLVLHVPLNRVCTVVQEHLKDYIINSGPTEDEDAMKVAIHLPPASLLLLRLQSQTNTTGIQLATDQVSTLPRASVYLRTLLTPDDR